MGRRGRVIELEISELCDKQRVVTFKMRLSQYRALESLVRSGLYPSVSEAVRDAIRRLLDAYSIPLRSERAATVISISRRRRRVV